MVLFYAMKHFNPWLKIIRFAFLVWFPLLYAAVILLVTENIFGAQYSFSIFTMKLSIFLIAFMPLLYYINKRSGVLNIIINLIKEKIVKR